VSDLESRSVRFNALPLMPPLVGIYFCGLVALTLIALKPGMITLGLLLFILPGLTLIAAPTLLYYSLAVLPGYLLARFLGNNLLGATVAAITLAAAALLPHYLGQLRLEKLLASDISDPVDPSFLPRSFELPYPERDDYWMNWRQTESRDVTPPPPCADLCQQLLFKGHIDHVIIRDHNSRNAQFTSRETLERGSDGSMHRMVHVTWLPRWRRFHLERRDSCPDTLSLIAPEFVHEVAGGHCLIEDTSDRREADVLVSLSKPLDVRGADGQFRPDLNIAFANVESDPTTITIAEQRDGKVVPAEIRTALHASSSNVPFYFTTRPCSGSELCLTAATEPFANSRADPFEMINRRYGLPVAPDPKPARLSAAPTSEDDRATVNAILRQDYGAGGLIPITQSKLVASFVNARLKSGQLNQDDIELIRMALKQHAFVASIETDKLPSETYQALKPLLPDMFERIAYRADGQEEMVQSLNVVLEHYPAEDTDAYSYTLCQDSKNAGLRVCYQREFRARGK
jgi:hypothetical protein